MSFTQHVDFIHSMVLTPGYIFTVNFDSLVRILSFASRPTERKIPARAGYETFTLTGNGDGLITNNNRSEFCLLSLKSGEEVRQWTMKEDDTRAVAVTTAGTNLISATQNAIKVWDLQSREELSTLEVQNQIRWLAMLPDGQHFVAIDCNTAEILLWRLQEGLVKTVQTKHIGKSIEVTPDGKFAVTQGKEIFIWNLPDLTFVADIKCETYIDSYAISKDSRSLASGRRDGVVQVWSIPDARLVVTLLGHIYMVTSLDFSANNKYLVSTDRVSIRLWSLEDKRQLRSMDVTMGKSGQFSRDMQSLIHLAGRLFVVTPLVIPMESLSAGPLQVSDELASIVHNLKEGTLVGELAAKTILSPYHVNSLHISAYFNHVERGRDYIKMGVPFLKGQFGSPITVSLKRKAVKCTDVLLQNLIDMVETTKDDSEWVTFACITDDLPALLTCGSALLKPFFAMLMQPPSTPPLPYFITPTSQLPIIISSDNRLLNIEDFDQSQGNIGSDLVKFNISLVKKNLTPGSTESLELNEALLECDDRTVLATPYISLLIERKWEYFYPYTLGFTILYAVMLSSMVMLLFHVWNPVPLCCLFGALNLFFMLYEMAQMTVTGCSYWLDPWNHVDLFRGLLCLFWSVLTLWDLEGTVLGEEWSKDVRLLLALMCFLRGFTYFRSFRMTRLFVYMTLAVIKEMYSFLIIMGYSVFAFGVCSATLLDNATLSVSWTSAFSLVLGDFDSSAFTFVEWVIFSCAALINVIIMLNLLVSIMSDAIGKLKSP